MPPQDRPRQQRHAGSHSAPGIHIGVVGIDDGDAVQRHPLHQQLTSIRHSGLQCGGVGHRQKCGRQRLRLPERADTHSLRRAICQGQALRQTSPQHSGVGGVNGARFLSRCGNHRAGNDNHTALGGGKRLLQPVIKAHAGDIMQRLGRLVSPIFLTDNKKPLNTAGQQLLTHPSDNGAKEHRLQHQRFHSGISAGTAGAKINDRQFVIHWKTPPIKRDTNSSYR